MMPEDKKEQRQFESDPWSQFMFGGPQSGPYGPPNENSSGQKSKSETQTTNGNSPQMSETMNSILGPLMTQDGNLDMKKVMSGMDQAMKMANQFGPAMKKIGPILDLFTKKK